MASTSRKSDTWNLTDVINYYLDDVEIAEGISKDDLQALHNPYTEFLRGALEYQGFNPKAILKEMIKRRNFFLAAKKPNMVWDLTNRDDEFKETPSSKPENLLHSNGPLGLQPSLIRRRNFFLAAKKPDIICDLTNREGEFKETPDSRPGDCLHSNGPLVKDIEILIFVFLHRNNHLGKIIKKSLPGLATILEHLREKYDINDEIHKSGTALGVTDITLPRIAGVMPAVAARLFTTTIPVSRLHISYHSRNACAIRLHRQVLPPPPH
ncbi:unnamed protein product [Euphydryas editha]|uniref:Uncharacterized protein n=1 Tax=Euphydryas editha TaxID=104508 RepID=A0AAU9TM23_EUPED|nr:unnamed protein product [Euphydryas editha]